MPEFGQDFRTQILVGLKAEGLGAADKLRDEIARLQRQLAQLYTDMGTGNKLWWDFREAFGPLNRELGDAAKRLRELEAAEAAQVAEQAALISSAGAWGAVLRQSGAVTAAYARQIEEESGKATQKQIADADKAIAAVARLSNETNALLDKDAAATEAAEQRKTQARAQAEAQHEAELGRMHQAHLEFLARETAAEAQASARHDAELGQAHRKHMEFLAREEAAEEERARHRQEILDRIRRAEANQAVIGSFGAAIEGVNREQEHLNDLLEEGARAEREATAAHAGMARAAAVEAIEIERLGGATVTHVTAADSATRAVNRLTKEEQELQSAILDVQVAVRRGGVSAFLDLDGAIMKGGRSAVLTTQQLDQTKGASERAAYATLHLAHAFQDLQYGFGAVLNNIPLVVQAVGGGPGLGGVLMATGVAFEMLKGRIGDVGVALGLALDPMQGFARTSEELKAKLEALEGKHFKVQMDYTEIERATKALKDHEEARKAFEAGTKTKPQGALAEEAKQVADAAGGTQALSQVILGAAKAQGMAFAPQSDIDREKAIRTRMIPALKKQVAESGNFFTRTFNQLHLAEWETKLEAVRQSIQKADIDFATQMAGRFAEGKEDAIKTVKGLAERQPQAFKPDARRRLKELPETAEEKEFKDMAEDADKFIDEQVEEGKKKAKADLKQAQDARAAEAGKHAAAFGTQKAMGGMLDEELTRLIAGGEKDPEALRRAVMGKAMAKIDESGVVPKDLLPDVAVKVIDRYVEKVIAELISHAGAGQDVVAAAKDDIAAGQAKAEKPEVAREAARVGHEADEAIRASILEGAAANLSPEQIRKGMMGPMVREMKEAKVAPEIAPDVAAKIFDEQLGKLRAEMVGRGGVNALTAQAMLGELGVKALGQEQGRVRHVERVQDVGRRPAIAQEIMFRSGGMASPEQAVHGAEQYQSLINRGVAPAVAENRVMSELARMIQQQRAIMDQTNAMMNGMANMLGQANQHLGMVGAQQGMMRGQMNHQRWQKPAPWNTIPGG